jgi:uncharacterized membrane protein
MIIIVSGVYVCVYLYMYICVRGLVCVQDHSFKVTTILTLYVKLDMFGHIAAFMMHMFSSLESLERHKFKL